MLGLVPRIGSDAFVYKEPVGITVSFSDAERVLERDAEANLQFYLPIALVPRLMFGVVTSLVLVSLVAAWLGRFAGVPFLAPDSVVDRLFNVDRELNVPTWFQGSTLLLCSAVLLVIAYSHWRDNRSPYWRWWGALGVGFAGLSFDELAGVHERLIAPMRDLLDDPGGLLYFPWVLPGIVIVVVLGAAFIPFLLSLPTWARNGFLVSAALFIGGALVMEMIDGAIISAHGSYSRLYVIGVHVEELLEMLGAVMFLTTLLEYIARLGGNLRLVR